MYTLGQQDVFQCNSIQKSPSNLEFFVPQQTLFNPLNYPLISWFDFNAISNITYDGLFRIASIIDRSSNAYIASQANDLYKPILTNVNGIWVARFDGNNDLMKCNFGTTYAQPFTIFTIWKTTNSNASQIIFDSYTTTNRNFLYHSNNYPGIIFGREGGASAYYTKIAPFNYLINCTVFNGTSCIMYENGVQKTLTAVTPPVSSGTNPLAGFTFGAGNASNQFLQGDLAEQIAIQGVLSEVDRGLFERYLLSKVTTLLL